MNETGQVARSYAAIAKHVSRCLELGLLLEVSGYPKPGNVHRFADFPETTYEQFLASAVACGPSFSRVARRGAMMARGKLAAEEIQVGRAVKDAVYDVNRWQRGGNTVLGSLLLLMPLAAGAGAAMTIGFSVARLRHFLKGVVVATTPMDAVHVYEAISAAKPGGMGKMRELDVNDPSSRRKIIRDRIGLYQIFLRSRRYDTIAREWVTNFSTTFELAYPVLMAKLRGGRDLNVAIVDTFLTVLSRVPDTLITRKFGLSKAQEVAGYAKKVLKSGGLSSERGAKQVRTFDNYLRRNDLNPGTTADILCVALSTALLGGLRP